MSNGYNHECYGSMIRFDGHFKRDTPEIAAETFELNKHFPPFVRNKTVMADELTEYQQEQWSSF